MNDNVPASAPAAARSPALRQLYDLIAEGASARDPARTHPFEALSLLRGARFGALLLPAAGGGGGSLRDVMEEAIYLAEADTNVAHIFRNHFTFVERFLAGSTDENCQGWRRTVLDGGIVGLATTELDRPQTGGTYPLKTTLTPDCDGFRLRGTKYDSTGSLYADLILVRATAPKTVGVTIVIPADRLGVELLDDWDGIGRRVTGTGTTNFHDVRVEAGEVIVNRDNPPYLLPYIGTIAQTFVTAVNAGIVRASLRDAKALLHSHGRTFYYAPAETASHDPILQQTIGRIAADAFAAELVVLAAADKPALAARVRSAGEPVDDLAHDAAVAAAKAKVTVDELALRAATALFDVGGASLPRSERTSTGIGAKRARCRRIIRLPTRRRFREPTNCMARACRASDSSDNDLAIKVRSRAAGMKGNTMGASAINLTDGSWLKRKQSPATRAPAAPVSGADDVSSEFHARG
jgi:alkylation response protein AidB-like acyl-CoA dehydrogenase